MKRIKAALLLAGLVLVGAVVGAGAGWVVLAFMRLGIALGEISLTASRAILPLIYPFVIAGGAILGPAVVVMAIIERAKEQASKK